MLSKDEFNALLRAEETLIIDGALASELEVRGYDLNHALWSAKILKDDPAAIEKVHTDYFLAGAHVAITSSYQAASQGLKDHFALDEIQSKALIRESVNLARRARDTAYGRGVDSSRALLVAGSVGPYGAYLSDGSEYRGDYSKTMDEFKDFHRPRIQALIDADVDLLALETMPSFSEIRALLSLLQCEFPDAIAWLSCTVRSIDKLSDGTSWKDVLDVVNKYDNQLVAFGFNCIPLSIVSSSLGQARCYTKLPLLCYPNSGESWDAVTKTWYSTSQTALQSSVNDNSSPIDASAWIKNGARLIGGCCRTGPAFIEALGNSLPSSKNSQASVRHE